MSNPVVKFGDNAKRILFSYGSAVVFVSPLTIEEEIAIGYGVECVGRTEDVTERFYLISVERRIRNPAVAAISANANDVVFGGKR